MQRQAVRRESQRARPTRCTDASHDDRGRPSAHRNHHSATTGEWRDGKGLVATSWLHTISRDGDPQLHVHFAVLNAVQRADGADDKWRAADGQHFYQLRHLYGVTVDRAFEQRLLAMGYAMTGRADGNGAEVGGVSPQVMDRFSSRARVIDGRLRTWVDQYTARHGTPPSRRTIYLMCQQIAKDTRRPKAEAKRMAGGEDTGHDVTDDERLKAWENQTTADEVQALSAVHAEAKAYAARSAARPRLAYPDKARAARIAVAEAQRQRSVWGVADLCLEIHRALPIGATPADITEVAMLAISGTAGAEVVQVSPAPDLVDVSSLGIRQSDGQSIFRKPNTMRWAALDHLNLEEQVISQARRLIRPLVTEQQIRDELDRHHQDLDGEQQQAVITLLTADRAMARRGPLWDLGTSRRDARSSDRARQPLGTGRGSLTMRRAVPPVLDLEPKCWPLEICAKAARYDCTKDATPGRRGNGKRGAAKCDTCGGGYGAALNTARKSW